MCLSHEGAPWVEPLEHHRLTLEVGEVNRMTVEIREREVGGGFSDLGMADGS
jgi:hypothetical protein